MSTLNYKDLRTQQSLRTAGKWARIFAIIGFVVFGFVALILIAILVMGAVGGITDELAQGFEEGLAQGAGAFSILDMSTLLVVVGIFGIIGLLVSIYINIKLFVFGRKLKAAAQVQITDMQVREAFSALKQLVQVLVISQGLSVLFSIGTIIFALLQ